MNFMEYVTEIEEAHGNIEVQLFKLHRFNEWLMENAGVSSDLFILSLCVDDCLLAIESHMQQIEHGYLNLP